MHLEEVAVAELRAVRNHFDHRSLVGYNHCNRFVEEAAVYVSFVFERVHQLTAER